MLFQVLCGFEPIFYTTHPNEEPKKYATKIEQVGFKKVIRYGIAFYKKECLVMK